MSQEYEEGKHAFYGELGLSPNNSRTGLSLSQLKDLGMVNSEEFLSDIIEEQYQEDKQRLQKKYRMASTHGVLQLHFRMRLR